MRTYKIYFTADTDMNLVIELLSGAQFTNCPRKIEFTAQGKRIADQYEYIFILDEKDVKQYDLISVFIKEQDIVFKWEICDSACVAISK